MPDPRISVVVPVARVDAALDEQLDALGAQRASVPFEVVLACNVDSPTTHDRLVAAAEARDATWRVVPAWDRRGPSHARNAGASAASGALLAFCDADDVVQPGWVDAMVEALGRSDAAGGHLEPFGLAAAELAARPPPTPGGLPTFLGVPYFLSANVGVRRAAFEAVGGFDESLETCEDIALSWRLQVAGFTVGWAPEAVIAYRHRAGLRTMLAQHVRYGRGMSQLLPRYGVPAADGWRPAGRLLVTGNGQPGAASSWRSRARRAAIAAGRLSGLVEERVRPGRGRRRSAAG